MTTVHSVRDGDWSDPGTWDGPMTPETSYSFGHIVTISTPMTIEGKTNNYRVRWVPYSHDAAIRAYRLFHPNRWNLKRAKWLARRAAK